VGFFTDAYDLFAITLVAEMLGYVYIYDGILPVNIELWLKVSAAVGTLVGQIVFGILADRIGRKRMYGVELWIIIVATIFTTLSGSGPYLNVFGLIIFWRVILGLGVGGDYPLSAIITSEFATKERRGSMMAAVFAMQGFGIFASILVAVITLSAAKNDLYEHKNFDGVDYVWRIILGLDSVELPRSSWEDFKQYFSKWKNAKILLGTCGAWFCIDVAYYGIGLNNTIFFRNALQYKSLPGIITNKHDGNFDAWTPLFHASLGNLIITLLGTIPGYWVSVYFIDRWGRRRIQFMGFAVLTVLFIVFGAAFHQIKDTSIFLFGAMFTLTQFFFNFGPNTTTFVVPGEVFPTRYRSTCYGISAAVGKLGAIFAQIAFYKLKNIGGKTTTDNTEYSANAAFIDKLLLGCAVFMIFGVIFTCFIPETKGKSLEELSNEDQTNFIRQIEN
ncbi:104_t:CDS:2, partial [Ambispora leptoticha]